MGAITRMVALALAVMTTAAHPARASQVSSDDGGAGRTVPDRQTTSDCNGNGVPDDIETAVVFRTHVVAAQVDGARFVEAGDLDGDGDMDVVSIAQSTDTVAWYANLNGEGTFGEPILIDVIAYPYSGAIADLDQDGDLDLLLATGYNVCWYENLDGAGSFSALRMIDDYSATWWSVDAEDFDGDGDLDVVAGSVGGDSEFLSWHRNVDGAGNFVLVQDMAFGAAYTSVAGADLDGDGDNDIVSADMVGIRWYENRDGLGDFGDWNTGTVGQTVYDDACCGFHTQVPEDVDGDGDVDLLMAVSSGYFAPAATDQILLFENTDGAAGFGPPQSISGDVPRSRDVHAADVNGDGSPDALSASYDDDKIAWYENVDGIGGFGPQKVVSLSADGAFSVSAADLDGDGDTDLLSGSKLAGRIDWYENRSNDCNGNGIPDSCEPDCNLNGIADSCDIRSGVDLDCDSNGVPDLCQSTCGGCDTDADRCLDEVDSHPENQYLCADTDQDQCNDCYSGSFDPWTDGPNSDSDGICDPGDCAPTDNEIWGEPSAIDSLLLDRTDTTAWLRWEPPEVLGGIRIRYDTLRSFLASDFLSSTDCIESDASFTQSYDPSDPGSGAIFFYLIRGETCPFGTGNMGTDSEGVPRTGRACP